MSVELSGRISGEGSPVLLLHGLFGSRENLAGLAQKLSETREVHALDLRNHGRSPHCESMSYPEMAEDVVAYMDRQALDRAAVVGHSMGGKVGMELALSRPERVDRLVAADIAPVSYPPRHDDILDGLESIDVSALKSRAEAEAQLRPWVETTAIRQFLLKNLIRSSDGGFQWRMNLPAIDRHYGDIAAAPSSSGPYTGPVLFLKGGDSGYIGEEAREPIRRLFPAALLRVIPGTGHWLHAEKPDLFANTVRRFLEGAYDQ